MQFELGPKKFGELALGSKILNIEVHKKQPILLASTQDHKLDSFYLQNSDKNGVLTRPLLMKSLQVDCTPQLIDFSGKNIVHCDQSILKINNKAQIIHKNKINHLLTDDQNIALSTCDDNIIINSIHKASIEGEMHYYGSNISSLFWNNSLVISGDESGMINLWDINKRKIINSNLVYAKKVNFLSSYVDFIHTNLYYSASLQEKRMSLHDLRTYKSIKIINNLPNNIVDIQHTKTGKVFIMTQKNLQFIDLYQGFSILGRFNEISQENIETFIRNNPDSSIDYRNLTNLLVWDKYAIVGCSNGCIEVYDSDLYTCLYSFGMCEFSGIKSLKRINESLIALQEKGLVNIAKLI